VHSLHTPFLDRLESEVYLVAAARAIGRDGHDAIGQVRKYTGEPYWHHTESVAEILAALGLRPVVIAATLIHDLFEDVVPHRPEYGVRALKVLGSEVIKLAMDVTDVFTKEAYPTLNRAERKAREADRLSKIPLESRLIKMADIYHNGSSIMAMDEKFAATYLAEKRAIVALFLRTEQQIEEELSVASVSDNRARALVKNAYFILYEKTQL
jgi:(p)ppGpp synthase/HD superfamily hydrolase